MPDKPTVFIDGHAGTIGLRIRELLAGRDDLSVLDIGERQRKDEAARRERLNAADVSILCLPDDAAKQAAAMVENPAARVIDGSTAHRVDPDWVYGLPELAAGQREAIAQAKRVANPGCYPTAVILLLRPLLDAGLLAADAPLAVHALSGYSGGGKPLIATWEDPENDLLSLPYEAPYALERRHKHVAEMVHHARLAHDPQFVPAVGPFHSGMRVEIPLPAALLDGTTAETLWETLGARYQHEPFVRVLPLGAGIDGGQRAFAPTALNDTNRIELRVLPHSSGHVLLMAILDNLGKGASAAAVQNLNLMLGLPEDRGLFSFRPRKARERLTSSENSSK